MMASYSLDTVEKVVIAERRQELELAAKELDEMPAPYLLSDLGQRAWRMGVDDAAKCLRQRAIEMQVPE